MSNEQDITYTLSIQEVGRAEPDVMQITQAEYNSLQEAIDNLGLFVIKMDEDNEVRYYNIEFLSSIRIKKTEVE